MTYKIADFFVNISFLSNLKTGNSKSYIASSDCVDLEINITPVDIEHEKKYGGETAKIERVEVSTALRKLAEWIPNNGAFVLHSATFDVDGTGVAFAAHSGTGKTTHMNLWQQLLGDRMTIVNGDKPIVRFFDDEPETPYAYGTPWNGKEKLGCNMRTPLKHICFIERCAENSVEPIEKSEAIDRIFNQVYMPKDPVAAMKTMQLIDRLMSCCKLWKIKCNMDISAAQTAYKGIFG